MSLSPSLFLPLACYDIFFYSGAKLPFEAIFVSCKDSASNPTIVVLHGGPHTVYPSSYSKSLAFLHAQGYNLLVVNYR
jgi:acylaminoacyl-peptidase